MTLRTIRTVGDPILRSRTSPVDPSQLNTRELAVLIRDMTDTLLDEKGLGLAATQVGSRLRIAIINGQDGPYAVINPRIVKRSIRTETDEEGCLSVPGVYGLVRRARSVTVTYLAVDGTAHREKVSGLLARVFQHEIDHLDGILFTDRTKKITKGTLL